MKRSLFLLLPAVLLTGCAVTPAEIRDGFQSVTSSTKSALNSTGNFAKRTVLGDGTMDLAAARKIDESLDGVSVTSKATALDGKRVQVLQSMTINAPGGTFTDDEDAKHFVESVTRFASNLSTPSTLTFYGYGDLAGADKVAAEYLKTWGQDDKVRVVTKTAAANKIVIWSR